MDLTKTGVLDDLPAVYRALLHNEFLARQKAGAAESAALEGVEFTGANQQARDNERRAILLADGDFQEALHEMATCEAARKQHKVAIDLTIAWLNSGLWADGEGWWGDPGVNVYNDLMAAKERINAALGGLKGDDVAKKALKNALYQLSEAEASRTTKAEYLPSCPTCQQDGGMRLPGSTDATE